MSALIGVCLAFVSSLFDQFFRLLNFLEKNIDRNTEIANRIIKLFWWKYFNSGILIIFIANKASFFGKSVGQFDDFTPNWFTDVGYSVQLAMITQVFVLLAVTLLQVLLPKLLQCCDRGCRLRYTKEDGKMYTKKDTQEELENVYTGAEFQIDVSYAEALKTLYISVTLAPLMPLVFLYGLMYFIVLYYKDKVLMVTVFKKPYNLDMMLNKIARKLLVWIIPITCVVSIWSFGQKSI